MRLETLNFIMLTVAGVLFVSLLVSTVLVSVYYRRLTNATDHYIQYQSDGGQISEASDYLTDQVRLYVATMDETYLDNYFTELNVTQRRENALADLTEGEDPDALSLAYLQSALDFSNSLSDTEIYAMKLVALSQNLDYPELSEVVLADTDANLTPKAMRMRAEDLVYSTEYLETKKAIGSYVSAFLTDTLNTVRTAQLECRSSIRRLLTIQATELALLFVTCVLNFVLNLKTVLHPLRQYARHIAENKPMDLSGPAEMQFLAHAFNEARSLTQANTQQLQYRANHDPLTHLLNREAFTQATTNLRDHPGPLAMLLIDIDTFKGINDTLGHEMGDRILRRVARLLQDTFRTKDLLIRLGGDEFAVILMDMTPDQMPVIEDRVCHMNFFLQNPPDDLPKVSLSVGVAFSPHGLPECLYGRADQALYRVKEHGRCGCQVTPCRKCPGKYPA
jgi:diguanylate cyclase (GGDEF)-like protein